MRDAIIRTVKRKEKIMCSYCKNHIAYNHQYLALIEESKKVNPIIVCENCIENISPQQWEKWGFDKKGGLK